jgi:hypothetical protein
MSRQSLAGDKANLAATRLISLVRALTPTDINHLI